MARVFGATLTGVDGTAVEVEVRIHSLLPRVDVVGLPEAAVRESAARVRAAIGASGFPFPDRRVTVNLAPAELRKTGAGLDLPIAVGILTAAGLLEDGAVGGLALAGELALDGRLRAVRGALALCLAARDAGCAQMVVPEPNAREAALAPGIEVRGATTLRDVAEHLRGVTCLPRAEPLARVDPPPEPDLGDVRGQQHAKRALEVVAAGGHALLLRGAPGCGKTMLARRLPGLLPPLDFEEALEVTRIHGAAGQLTAESPVLVSRPLRAPHHTASPAGLLGGGSPPRPGEVSLAHRGVLFLDELPEFDRRSLEALRQVLEQRQVVIARARASCSFPAHFQLVAACNPCPCGWRGAPGRDCRCADAAVARSLGRLSGPLLDRVDLHVGLRPLRWNELERPACGAESAAVASRVLEAREIQARRGSGRFRTNAELPDDGLDPLVDATAEARALLGRAVDRLALSARGARRVLRVARTIADLARERRTPAPAVAEALGYRAPHPGGEIH